MTKHALAISFMLICAQAIASTPCPTCKKGYVTSSLEEVLISRQGTKRLDLKRILEDSSISQGKGGESAQEKLPVTNIVNRAQQHKREHRSIQAEFQPHAPRSLAPKRDGVLEIAGAPSRPLYLGSNYFSNDQGNGNLRGTFDRNMTISTQQQLRQHIRNLKK